MEVDKKIGFHVKTTRGSQKPVKPSFQFDLINDKDNKKTDTKKKELLVISLPAKYQSAKPEKPAEPVTEHVEKELASPVNTADKKPFLDRYGLIKSETRVTKSNLPSLWSSRFEAVDYFEDVAKRPEAPTQAAYETVPIEEFGAAMLRGMGWKGDREKKSKIVEPISRPERLGLGAESKIDVPIANESSKKRKDSKTSDSSSNQAPLSQAKLEPGFKVVITSGSYEGSKGVIDRVDDEHCIVKINSNIIRVPIDSVKCSHSSQSIKSNYEEKSSVLDAKKICLDSDERLSKNASEQMLVGKQDRHAPHKHHSRYAEKFELKKHGKTEFWIMENIKVRISSKRYASGKHYCRKGVIRDVCDGTRCIVKLDNGPTLDDVQQEHLETVIPQKDGQVIVVRGPDRGIRGTVVSRDDEHQTVDIYTLENFLFKTYPMDDIAQYVYD